jgi:hypothetical protein
MVLVDPFSLKPVGLYPIVRLVRPGITRLTQRDTGPPGFARHQAMIEPFPTTSRIRSRASEGSRQVAEPHGARQTARWSAYLLRGTARRRLRRARGRFGVVGPSCRQPSFRRALASRELPDLQHRTEVA